jgi:thiamine biosynthesis lipoprotein
MELMIGMKNEKLSKISVVFRAMGTDVSADIVSGDSSLVLDRAYKAMAHIKNIFADNEKIFSRFQAYSELMKINHSLDNEVKVSDKMYAVLELCVKFYELSGGYFDPRVLASLEKIGYTKDFRTNDLNSVENKEIQLEKIKCSLQGDLCLNSENKTVLIHKRIDTTGIAKGYTVDEVAQYLQKEGFVNFVVDAGGDMFAFGMDEKKEAWKIGVEGMEDDRLMLKLNNEGIATSGISRKRWQIGEKKFHHLVNPKDPENFSFDIKTVTVIAEKTVEADGRAKVLVLMGKEKGLKFANTNNIKALFLDYKGNVYLSEAIKKNIIEL